MLSTSATVFFASAVLFLLCAREGCCMEAQAHEAELEGALGCGNETLPWQEAKSEQKPSLFEMSESSRSRGSNFVKSTDHHAFVQKHENSTVGTAAKDDSSSSFGHKIKDSAALAQKGHEHSSSMYQAEVAFEHQEQQEEEQEISEEARVVTEVISMAKEDLERMVSRELLVDDSPEDGKKEAAAGGESTGGAEKKGEATLTAADAAGQAATHEEREQLALTWLKKELDLYPELVKASVHKDGTCPVSGDFAGRGCALHNARGEYFCTCPHSQFMACWQPGEQDARESDESMKIFLAGECHFAPWVLYSFCAFCGLILGCICACICSPRGASKPASGGRIGRLAA